jgi:hypothetical protein
MKNWIGILHNQTSELSIEALVTWEDTNEKLDRDTV